MEMDVKEYLLYPDFNELAKDILTLAKEVLPDSFLFLSVFMNGEQHVLEISENNEKIHIAKGMSLPLNVTVCNKIDFSIGKPLIFEDVREESCLDDVRNTISSINIQSYLGIPVILRDGEVFGTLCAVYENATKFNEHSANLIAKIAKMFSYYLDLERIAYRDYLTGSYNRYFLEKNFHEFSEKEGTIFLLDLDGFKEINDHLGHSTGDVVLKEVSVRMKKVIKQKDLDGAVFRLGGDEFVIHLAGLINQNDLGNIAASFNEVLSSWDIPLIDYHLSASIGIVTYLKEKEIHLNELLKQADNALYRAKAKGKNTYQFFE